MCRFVERMIALGLLMIVAVISIGCTVGGSKEEEVKQLVITNSSVDMEQSSSGIKIYMSELIVGHIKAINEIIASNKQFAPDGYPETSEYVENCLMVRIEDGANFILDAEHMIAVAQYEYKFYIQYDSADSAIEAMKNLNQLDKVIYAEQDMVLDADFLLCQ